MWGTTRNVKLSVAKSSTISGNVKNTCKVIKKNEKCYVEYCFKQCNVNNNINITCEIKIKWVK